MLMPDDRTAGTSEYTDSKNIAYAMLMRYLIKVSQRESPNVTTAQAFYHTIVRPLAGLYPLDITMSARKKSQRLTISGRNLQFLQDLSAQMDEPNLAAVMTYLLTDIRGLGYRFGDKPAPTQPRPQTRIGYSFDPSTFEPAFASLEECDRNQNNYTETDPIIARMSQLIEEF